MPLPPSCKDKEIAYYAHSLISLLIMFGCGQLTPITPLTPLGMNLIGIFLGVLYGWIFIDIIWPSMAGLLALMLIGGMKPNELFQTSFGDPLVMMMFFIFVFCATINYYGLSNGRVPAILETGAPRRRNHQRNVWPEPFWARSISG